jgi:hypothetical protein
MSRWRRLAALLTITGALVGGVAACGSDDEPTVGGDQAGKQTGTSDTPGNGSTAPASIDRSEKRCRELIVLLKLDVSPEQRSAIENKIKSLGAQVKNYRFEEAGSDTDSPSFRVEPAKVDQEQQVGTQFYGMDGVASVVFPNQVC